MPGFELFGEAEKKEVQDVLNSGVLMRYGFDGLRQGHWKAKELEKEIESNFDVNFRIDTPKEIANVFNTKLELGLDGGMLVTNPIPLKYSMDRKLIDIAISNALTEMDELGIKGKEATPYLLGKVVELTKGSSLKSNISSLSIQPGYRVTVFEDFGFKGRSMTFSSSTANLAGLGWNDNIRSFIVFRPY